MKTFFKRFKINLNIVKGYGVVFFERYFTKYFAKSHFLAGLYFFLFSNRFKREQMSVLAGKSLNIKQSQQSKTNLYTLVRNIHRIEKGLIMRPRRKVFAVDYIQETVGIFINLVKDKNLLYNSQIFYAHNVLSKYFDVVGGHSTIDDQKAIFYSQKIILDNNKQNLVPFQRSIENKPKITFDDFYALTKYRRSVRWFLQKKVPHNLIDNAILAANQSPSACNRQPYEFRVIDDVKLLKELVSLPMGVAGYSHNIPMMIVIVGNLDAYFHERDRHLIYIDSSLASMSLILALETLGLASCCINWPDIENLEIKMEKLLKLKKHQRAIMCLAVGYPDIDGFVPYSQKKELSIIRKYN